VTNFKVLMENKSGRLRRSIGERSGCPIQEFKSGPREYEPGVVL
jgi:hypothetical protein